MQTLRFGPVSSLFFFPLPNLSGRRLHVYHISTRGVALVRISNAGLICAAHGSLQMQDLKSHQKFAIWAPSHSFVGLYLCNWGTYQQSEKSLLNSNVSPTCPHNIVNFGPLAAEICWRVWGIPANFNRFCILTALLHGILVVGVSQTLQCWTEGAIYIWQGGDHVGHWPTFLVSDKVIIYNLTTHPTRCFTMLWYIDGWKLTVIWNTLCLMINHILVYWCI